MDDILEASQEVFDGCVICRVMSLSYPILKRVANVCTLFTCAVEVDLGGLNEEFVQMRGMGFQELMIQGN